MPRIAAVPSHRCFAGVLSLAIAVGTAGCGVEPRSDALPSVMPGVDGPPLPAKSDRLYVKSTQVWGKWAVIKVCWEEPGWDTEKEWARQQVLQTWGLETGVTFRGWALCQPTESSNNVVRIHIADVNPYTAGLGREINHMTNGVVFDFTFVAWGPACQPQREFCIRAIAAHEFGHVLAFAHEQNRSDTPPPYNGPPYTDPTSSLFCGPQGGNGDWFYGSWDIHSIMNYCNVFNNGGYLSSTDISGAIAFYGGPHPISATSWGANRNDLFIHGVNGDAKHTSLSGTQWSGVDLLGGTLASDMTAISWTSGGLDAFMQGPNTDVQQKCLDNGGWHGWTSLGGSIAGTPAASTKAGLVDIVARSSVGDYLYHKRWNGTSWTNFVAMNVQGLGKPAVLSVDANNVYVFYHNRADHKLAYVFYNGTSWGAPQILGGTLLLGDPVVISATPGRVDAFFVASDYSTYQVYKDASGWHGPTQIAPANSSDRNLAVASSAPNRIDLFAGSTYASDSNVLVFNTNALGAWGGWQLISADGTGAYWNDLCNGVLGGPAATSFSPGRLDVFIDGQHKYLASGTWSWFEYVNVW